MQAARSRPTSVVTPRRPPMSSFVTTTTLASAADRLHFIILTCFSSHQLLGVNSYKYVFFLLSWIRWGFVSDYSTETRRRSNDNDDDNTVLVVVAVQCSAVRQTWHAISSQQHHTSLAVSTSSCLPNMYACLMPLRKQAGCLCLFRRTSVRALLPYTTLLLAARAYTVTTLILLPPTPLAVVGCLRCLLHTIAVRKTPCEQV